VTSLTAVHVREFSLGHARLAVLREFKGVVIAEDDVVRAQLDDVVLRHLVCVIG